MYSFMLSYKTHRNSNLEIASYSRAGQCIQFLHMKPDIIILDYKLLKPNATEIVQSIKESLKDISILILYDLDDTGIFPELIDHKDHNKHCYIIKENDSIKLADKLIQTINNLIEEKRDKKKLLKQKFILLGVGLIVVLISVIIFLS